MSEIHNAIMAGNLHLFIWLAQQDHDVIESRVNDLVIAEGDDLIILNGVTPLMMAADLGQVEICTWLCDSAKASVHAQDTEGR